MTERVRLLIVALGLIIPLSYVPLAANAQTAFNLDAANGFKEFKFGMTKANWAGQLGAANTKIDNMYGYKGSCCPTAFGFAVRGISLGFDDADKLVHVIITLRDRQQAEGQRKAYKTVREAFGKIYGGDIKQQSGDIMYQWIGQKAGLSMVNEYRGAAEGGWEITLWFSDAKLLSSPADDY